ncbi:MAG: hypothetical protein WD648_05680, partial [Planctomycetaceae bacterium]
VRAAVLPFESAGDDGKLPNGIRQRLDTFPPHYLSTTPPDRIAADLAIIGNLQPGQVVVKGKYESETDTVEYRVFAFERDVKGCFHRTCGALSAKRLEILSAQISTTSDGVVVDGFRVLDNDFDGTVPEERIDEVAESVRNTLLGKIDVPELFQRHRRYNATRTSGPLSNLPTRVVVDNRSSDRCTIIDVFAHDRPALLYTIARMIYQMDLSVELAKIATHLDQVVDVFYVTGLDGRKVEDEGRLQYIRDELTATIVEFTRQEPGCVPV